MFGLYLYTLIIGHKSCNTLSILNKILLQKNLQNFVTNNVFFDKKKIKTQQQNRKSNIKNPCWSRELSLEPLAYVTSAPLNQLRVTIVVELLNYSNAMGRNINKQSRICGQHIYNKFIFFCNIFRVRVLIYKGPL